MKHGHKFKKKNTQTKYIVNGNMVKKILNKITNLDGIKHVYNLHKNYSKALGSLLLRRPIFPEFVSEGLIKIILNKTIDSTSVKCNTGDLISTKEGRQECKCFTSNAPLTFGPKQKWSVLYVLDGRNYTDDKFTLYRIGMTSEEFSEIKISKNETYKELCNQKRRPKIIWSSLKPQLKNCDIIFNGSIDEIDTLKI